MCYVGFAEGSIEFLCSSVDILDKYSDQTFKLFAFVEINVCKEIGSLVSMHDSRGVPRASNPPPAHLRDLLAFPHKSFVELLREQPDTFLVASLLRQVAAIPLL